MDVNIPQNWKVLLKDEFKMDYFKKLTEFVDDEYSTFKIYPSEKLIYRAFEVCSFKQTKVVIIGQDPYHGAGQANGLCFSVGDTVKIPPSLANIYKEIRNDIGELNSSSGNLETWGEQGVLLLNATFTVRESTPGSHQNKGWEQFTDAVIKTLSDNRENLVFLLWGAFAQKKGEIIDSSRHLVLKSAHPSPFSAHRGFLGNKHFSKTNEFLKSKKLKPIIW